MSRPHLKLLTTLDVLLTEGCVARAAQRLSLSPSALRDGNADGAQRWLRAGSREVGARQLEHSAHVRGGKREHIRMLAAAVVAGAALHAPDASAEPFHGWHLSLERLFGASRAERTFEPESGATQVELHSTLAVLSSRAPQRGYSAPRLGVDYLTAWGLTAGVALGVEALVRAAPEARSGLDENAIGAVLSPRVGYRAQLSGWSLWPRVGATHLLLSRGDDRTAVTFEVAMSLPLRGERLQLQLVPYLEVGLRACPTATPRKVA